MASDIDPILDALIATLQAALPQIDQASKGDFLPPVKTADTALILPPFGYRTEVEIWNLAGETYQIHRLPAELWVKHQGDDSDTAARVRTAILDTVTAVQADQTLSGTVDSVGAYNGQGFELQIEGAVDDLPVEVGGVPYVVARLTIPVTIF